MKHNSIQIISHFGCTNIILVDCMSVYTAKDIAQKWADIYYELYSVTFQMEKAKDVKKLIF